MVAIGDIHGRADLLERLLARIKDELAETNSSSKPVLVLLGDYVDRGYGSKAVIERIIELVRDPGLETRTLKGNHEQALMTFLQDSRFGPTWCEHGGAQTLASYGVTPPRKRNDDEAWEGARRAFAEALPPNHLTLLSNLEPTAVYGDYLFVHAGIRPGVPLEAQTEQDLLWIRRDFLTSEKPFDKIVVHGHTPEPEPFLGARRIGVDTGAYATGVLTAVLLRDSERRIIQSRPRRN